jgi:methyl acetate hydrolase
VDVAEIVAWVWIGPGPACSLRGAGPALSAARGSGRDVDNEIDRGDLGNEIDRVLGAAVARGDLVGAAAAVVTPNGEFVGAAGRRDGGAAMTPDTILWIASMTKAVTAVAAMQLVEQGRLGLDDPCGRLVPYLADVQVLTGFSAAGEPLLRPPVRPVTLRQLLTHTAGFGYPFADARIARYVAGRPESDSVEGSGASYRQPLLFDPGEQWSYGISIDWVGQVIEAVTGSRLDRYLDAEVFQPLGMLDTGFARDSSRRGRTAAMHVRTAGGLMPVPFELAEDPEFLMAGGGLYGSVLDYLRFVRMILGDGTLDGVSVLRADTVADMAANHIGTLTAGGWRTAQAGFSNDVEFFPGTRKHWGLSFLINTETTPEGRSPGSLAWAGLANSYYWIDRTRQVAGVFATQVLPFFDPPALDAFRLVELATYDSL